MPSILELLAADQGKSARCRLCTFVEGREPKEREQWKTAIADPGSYNHASIARLVCKLIDEDVKAGKVLEIVASNRKISQETVMNHRAKNHVIAS